LPRGSKKTTLACSKCKDDNGIYTRCIKLKGFCGGACGNCKRQDKGSTCEVRDTDKHDFRSPAAILTKEFTTQRQRRTTAPQTYKAPDGRKSLKPKPAEKDKPVEALVAALVVEDELEDDETDEDN
jgi:hypothetical protein